MHINTNESDPLLDSLRDTKMNKSIVDYENRLKGELKCSGYNISIGNHGLIFVTPTNKGNSFTKSFETIEAAHKYYIQ